MQEQTNSSAFFYEHLKTLTDEETNELHILNKKLVEKVKSRYGRRTFEFEYNVSSNKLKTLFIDLMYGYGFSYISIGDKHIIFNVKNGINPVSNLSKEFLTESLKVPQSDEDYTRYWLHKDFSAAMNVKKGIIVFKYEMECETKKWKEGYSLFEQDIKSFGYVCKCIHNDCIEVCPSSESKGKILLNLFGTDPSDDAELV